VDRDDWPNDDESVATIHARWQEPHGDRQQELVLIGMQMDQIELTAAFDACFRSGRPG
jgi:G3E family GTPase